MPTSNSLTRRKRQELTNILTSLYYLSKESKSADLTEVSQLIRQCIKCIEDWTQSEGKNIAHFVANEETFHILEFLSTFAQAPPKTRQHFLTTLSADTALN